jgi:hypothetical protein
MTNKVKNQWLEPSQERQNGRPKKYPQEPKKGKN